MGFMCTSPFLCTVLVLSLYTYQGTALESLECDKLVPNTLVKEIQGYQDIANKIIAAARSGPWKGRTYKNLAHFADKFGNRITGSEALEKSIDWAIKRFEEDKLENVKTEDVNVKHWVR